VSITHLVEYRSLSVAFGTKEVVHSIDFYIDAGETFALVGESGSGKTVSAQALLRLLDGRHIQYPHGEVLFEGKDILRMKDAQVQRLRGSSIGMIFQEPLTSLNPLHTIEKQLAESLFLHQGLAQNAAKQVIIQWLERVGLRDPQKRLGAYPHQLSGGERQRVMIALALLNNPRLLIADEPTTALDVTVQERILHLLKALQKDMGIAILFITHDLELVRRMADRVAVMKDGFIVETNATAALFAQPQEPYTRALISATVHEQTPDADPSAPIVASVSDLKVYFPIKSGVFRKTVGSVKAVDCISLNLYRGQTVGVVGESGSGKSTLGKALLKLEKSTAGTISIGGTEIQSLSEKNMRPLRRSIQIIFQDPYGSLSPRMTIEEIVGEGLIIHRIGTKADRQARVMAALKEVGMAEPDFLPRYPHEFSGGQRQRIALARSLVLEPEILVLDEPTSSLDRSIQFQVISFLKDLQKRRGLSYLFISHDLRIVRNLCHYLLIMKEGVVVEAGAAGKIIEHPHHPYTQELLRTAFANVPVAATP
jgi:microcin C transport system ATP-binding protein